MTIIRVRRNHCFPLHSLVTYVDGGFKLANNMYVISRSMVYYSEVFGKSFEDSERKLPNRLNVCGHSPWRTANSIFLEYKKCVSESLEIIMIVVFSYIIVLMCQVYIQQWQCELAAGKRS
jgi:hypothetical protein